MKVIDASLRVVAATPYLVAALIRSQQRQLPAQKALSDLRDESEL